MKKTYFAPAMSVDTMEEEQMLLNVSFKGELNDEGSVSANDILGRENSSSVWDDEE